MLLCRRVGRSSSSELTIFNLRLLVPGSYIDAVRNFTPRSSACGEVMRPGRELLTSAVTGVAGRCEAGAVVGAN